ncbi:DUF397 domain-containing protein [Actinomadura sp. 9N407]|uniref:DUF397 domain-containing protein n=1 Tax=Actinomadura sp. 9N407 TaxID=3375154 RepID=UPI003788317C
MNPPHIIWRTSSHSTDQGHCVEVGTWHKSSYSSQQGNCVEIGAWRKSSHSIGNGGECVEVAADQALVVARDSKDPDGAVLGFAPEDWRSFVRTVKSGRLDLS